MANNKKTYFTVITFLILEVLAFIAFNLTNSVILYAIGGFGLLFAVAYVNIDKIKAKDFLPIAIVLVPLVIFAILNIVSPYLMQSKGLSMSLLSSIAMVSFLMLGYLSQSVKQFNLYKGLLVIYCSIAVLMCLGLLLTFISYTPFYTWLYSNSYIYYQGTRISVSDSAKMLYGFGIGDVSIQYFQLFGTILLSSFVALRHVSIKKQTGEFVLFALCGMIGLIAVIFTINKTNLLTFAATIALLLVIVFYPKKDKQRKVLSYVGLGLLGIVCILGIIFVLNALDVSFVSSIIRNNSILNKLFTTNRISAAWVEGINRAFISNNLFGLNLLHSGGAIYTSSIYSSGNIFIDAFSTNGILGGLVFLVFGVLAIRQFIKYYFSSFDDEVTRKLVCALAGAFLMYCLFAYDLTPLKDNINAFDILPFQFNGLFMVVLFLLGRTALLKFDNEKEIVKEEIETIENDIIIESEIDLNE